MSINAQIRKLEMENFKTKPLNRPVYINPFLLKSDAQILTDIYNKKTTPPIMADKKLKNKDEKTTTAPTSAPTSTPTSTPTSAQAAAAAAGGGTAAAASGEPAAEAPATATQADAPPRQGDVIDLDDEADAAAANDAAHSGTRDNAGAAPTDPESDPIEGASRLGEGSVSDLQNPETTIIPDSPGGAGNTMANRMRTASANFNNDGVTLHTANTQVTASHPPIVPVTDRITNNVGISNSLLSSLYDKLPTSSKTKLTTRAGTSGFLQSSDYPELQTIFPAEFRRDKQIRTYRITSAGNIYAYVYGGQSRPIYIGNWRESYAFTHPPTHQPANPHGTTPRPAPVSTQLGPTP